MIIYLCFDTGLISLAKALAKGNGKELGLKGVPSLLPATVPEIQQMLTDPKQCDWAEEFVIGIDPLHNMKGNTSKVVATMRTWKGEWDDIIFNSSLEENIQRRLVSELDGAHYRLLVVSWPTVILPALHSCSEPKKTMAKMFFHHLCEVATQFTFPPFPLSYYSYSHSDSVDSLSPS